MHSSRMRTARPLPYGGLPDRDPPGQRPLQTETPPGRRPHGQRPPRQRPPDRDPPDTDPPPTEIPWTETPLDIISFAGGNFYALIFSY